MSELIPKLKKSSGGGGWETPWFFDRRPNWLAKIEHDEEKNETTIKIVHNTLTHVAVPKYLEDYKWLKIEESKTYYPKFQCPVCKRKSTGSNFLTLWDMLVNWHIDKALKDEAKVTIAPELTTAELTKLLNTKERYLLNKKVSKYDESERNGDM